MYCSQICLEQAFERYHRYECPVITDLLTSGSVHIVLRLFFITLSTFDGSVDKLENFLNENENGTSTIFDLASDANGREREKNYLLFAMSMIKCSKSYTLYVHEAILKKNPELNEIWQLHEEFIGNFLQRLCQIADLNIHGIFGASIQKTSSNVTDVRDLQHSIGTGSLLFSSLVNHSCANNLLRMSVEGKIVYVVCRPVAQGSQLFDCYKQVDPKTLFI